MSEWLDAEPEPPAKLIRRLTPTEGEQERERGQDKMVQQGREKDRGNPRVHSGIP